MTFKTAKELLDFINDLDGDGLVVTSDDDLLEAIEHVFNSNKGA